ncbi:3-oxoacyl-[acyl-carrier-protein] reductase FabG [Microbulbifer aestuariivivens]|uniref:3-oxoacyl-[acyl-carrier-protein] reductase FabG n=1 Tax=Microbulbifer aestuariivivens TaxID=1908308 RepID=A0ABP9WRC7_9GAMM
MRNALITGAAARLGRAIARELHRDHRVIIHYRHSATAAQRLAQELNQLRPDSAAALQSDLDCAAGCEQLAQQARDLWGGVDVLVNNASSFYPTPIGSASEKDWDQLLDSNLKAPFFLSQALAPSLVERSGCIVNMIDIHAERPMPRHTIYCTAKAGLAMLTKSLALELAPRVRVNGVAPGAILWPEQQTGDAGSEENKARTLSRIPLARTGSEADITRTVRFLVDEPSYISGQIIAVDGGRSLTT